MKLFNSRKPRGFHHEYIYYDERKEKLAKREEDIKIEMGLAEPKPFDPESIRGKIVEQTTHLKRRKQSKSKPIHPGLIIAAIVLLIFVMHYLMTGNWTF